AVEVWLWQPISFRELDLYGTVAFMAYQKLTEPCLTIDGATTLHPGAAVRIIGCQNRHRPRYTDKDRTKMSFDPCTWARGGALHAGGDLTIEGAHLEISGSSTTSCGGAIYVAGFFNLAGSSMLIHRSHAGFDGDAGGALYVVGNLTVANATLEVSTTHAFRGGALHSNHHINVVNSTLAVTNAQAEFGGALSAFGSLQLAHASVTLSHVQAGHSGGGAHCGRVTVAESDLTISHAEAQYAGGAFYAFRDVQFLSGHISIDTVFAGLGGGIYAEQTYSQHLGRLDMFRVAAKGRGAGIYAGRVEAAEAELMLQGTMRGSAVYAEKLLRFRKVNCSAAPGCVLRAFEKVLKVGELFCHRGEGFLRRTTSLRCHPCPEQTTRLTGDATLPCTQCPEIPRIPISCEPAKVALPAGTMVNIKLNAVVSENSREPYNLTDLTEWYFCPNRQACPGGIIEAGRWPGEAPRIQDMPCRKGFCGRGCVHCDSGSGFARSDSDVLHCIKCADKVMVYILMRLARDVGFFTFAAVRGFLPDYPSPHYPWSAVSKTEAMAKLAPTSFAACGKEFSPFVNRGLLWFFVAEENESLSAECLLRHFGYPQELYLVHLMSSVLPAVLVGGWLAAVVGTNVFLPSFSAAFGKYLVSYRVRPEAYQDYQLGFLPPLGLQPHTTVAVIASAITCCFLIGPGSWIYVLRRRHHWKDPPHVRYLMSEYRTGCSAWEAAQMWMVSLVLLSSTALYHWFSPYKDPNRNHFEFALLLAALAMIGLTSLLLTNDLDWASSLYTELCLIGAICTLAFGIITFMMIFLAWAFYKELLEWK
ncbi:unnamed protein product, partial [Symbiodinium natans]